MRRIIPRFAPAAAPATPIYSAVYAPWIAAGVGKNPARVGRQFAFKGPTSAISRVNSGSVAFAGTATFSPKGFILSPVPPFKTWRLGIGPNRARRGSVFTYVGPTDNAQRVSAGSTQFAGIGSLNPTAAELARAAATFAGVGAFTVVGSESAKGSVAFSGAGSFAPQSAQAQQLIPTGPFQAWRQGIGPNRARIGSSFTFVGPTDGARKAALGAVAFAGIGNLSPTAAELAKASATFAGVGSFAPVGAELAKGSTAFAGAGSLNPVGAETEKGSVAFGGIGSFSAVGAELAKGSTQFAGTGAFTAFSLTAAVVPSTPFKQWRAGVGPNRARLGSSFTYVGTTENARKAVAASAAFSGIGSLTPTAAELARAAATFSGAGSFSVAGKLTTSGLTAFAGVGAFAPKGAEQARGLTAFAGAGALNAAGNIVGILSASVSFAGRGSFAVVQPLRAGGGALPFWLLMQIEQHRRAEEEKKRKKKLGDEGEDGDAPIESKKVALRPTITVVPKQDVEVLKQIRVIAADRTLLDEKAELAEFRKFMELIADMDEFV